MAVIKDIAGHFVMGKEMKNQKDGVIQRSMEMIIKNVITTMTVNAHSRHAPAFAATNCD